MSDDVDLQKEERQAFWIWWQRAGHTELLKSDGPLMLEAWLAGIEWARANERSMHDTPEV
jgi:hypothetical protein